MNEKRSPTLVRVLRLDSIPLDGAQFTKEGYLMDRPVVTTTGIFEYTLPDGSIRRELRLPEDVFDAGSLETYKGKPIILTHAGGRIDASNVQGEHIGTILSDGYQDGEDVRAEIVIHDPSVVKRSGLKELSLGYECDFDETPGEWEGQTYDAIQHNIRINHLAVVHKARAGEKARLNIDGEDEILKGGKKKMRKFKTDGFTPEQEAMFKAFLEWQAAQGGGTAAMDEGDPATVIEEKTDEEVIEQVRSHQDEGEPSDPASALARSKEDVNALLGIIDKMNAQNDMGASVADEGDPADPEKADEDDPEKTDESDPADPEKTDEGENPAEEKKMNADSIDELVRTRVEIVRVGDRLNMDGLDALSTRDAKKRIVLAVNPGMRLDGKSNAYIDAAYDVAKTNIMRPKDINYQRSQISGAVSSGVVRQDAADNKDKSAEASRQRMLERRGGKK